MRKKKRLIMIFLFIFISFQFISLLCIISFIYQIYNSGLVGSTAIGTDCVLSTNCISVDMGRN